MATEYQGVSVATAAQMLNVGTHQIYAWLRQHDPETLGTVLEKYVAPDVEPTAHDTRVSIKSIERLQKKLKRERELRAEAS